MKMKTAISAGALALLAAPTWAQSEDELTLIVSRGEDAATYYLSMPADQIEPLLATDPDLLFSQDGRVPINKFRLTGSFDLADDIFSNITGSVAGNDFEFEAMSIMVHPTATPLPFAAPWDAYTAISVCSVDYDPAALVPGLLQMYYGGFTDNVSGNAPLNIHFPETGRDDMQIVVHRYEDGRLMGTDVQTLSDGGTLVIEKSSGFVWPAWLSDTRIWLAIGGLFFGALAVMGLRRRGETPDVLNTQS